MGIPTIETTLTLGWGQNSFQGQHPFTKRFDGIFGSLYAKPIKDLTFIGEVDGFNLNLGAQYDYKNFGFKASVVSLEQMLGTRTTAHRFSVGVSYLFDKYAEARGAQPLFMGQNAAATPNGTKETVLSPNQENNSSNNDLLEELKRLRQQREEAQKVLDDLKNQLKQMESESGNGQ